MPARTAQQTEARATRVYVIQRAGGGVKIGISRNPKRRISELRVSTPETLVLAEVFVLGVGRALEVETAAKRLLAPWRIRGEWFSCGTGLAAIGIEAARDADARKIAFLRALVEHEATEHAWDHAEMRCRRSRDKEAAIAACDVHRASLQQISGLYPELWVRLSSWNELDITPAALAGGGAQCPAG